MINCAPEISNYTITAITTSSISTTTFSESAVPFSTSQSLSAASSSSSSSASSSITTVTYSSTVSSGERRGSLAAHKSAANQSVASLAAHKSTANQSTASLSTAESYCSSPSGLSVVRSFFGGSSGAGFSGVCGSSGGTGRSGSLEVVSRERFEQQLEGMTSCLSCLAERATAGGGVGGRGEGRGGGTTVWVSSSTTGGGQQRQQKTRVKRNTPIVVCLKDSIRASSAARGSRANRHVQPTWLVQESQTCPNLPVSNLTTIKIENLGDATAASSTHALGAGPVYAENTRQNRQPDCHKAVTSENTSTTVISTSDRKRQSKNFNAFLQAIERVHIKESRTGARSGWMTASEELNTIGMRSSSQLQFGTREESPPVLNNATGRVSSMGGSRVSGAGASRRKGGSRGGREEREIPASRRRRLLAQEENIEVIRNDLSANSRDIPGASRCLASQVQLMRSSHQDCELDSDAEMAASYDVRHRHSSSLPSSSSSTSPAATSSDNSSRSATEASSSSSSCTEEEEEDEEKVKEIIITETASSNDTMLSRHEVSRLSETVTGCPIIYRDIKTPSLELRVIPLNVKKQCRTVPSGTTEHSGAHRYSTARSSSEVQDLNGSQKIQHKIATPRCKLRAVAGCAVRLRDVATPSAANVRSISREASGPLGVMREHTLTGATPPGRCAGVTRAPPPAPLAPAPLVQAQLAPHDCRQCLESYYAYTHYYAHGSRFFSIEILDQADDEVYSYTPDSVFTRSTSESDPSGASTSVFQFPDLVTINSTSTNHFQPSAPSMSSCQPPPTPFQSYHPSFVTTRVSNVGYSTSSAPPVFTTHRHIDTVSLDLTGSDVTYTVERHGISEETSGSGVEGETWVGDRVSISDFGGTAHRTGRTSSHTDSTSCDFLNNLHSTSSSSACKRRSCKMTSATTTHSGAGYVKSGSVAADNYGENLDGTKFSSAYLKSAHKEVNIKTSCGTAEVSDIDRKLDGLLNSESANDTSKASTANRSIIFNDSGNSPNGVFDFSATVHGVPVKQQSSVTKAAAVRLVNASSEQPQPARRRTHRATVSESDCAPRRQVTPPRVLTPPPLASPSSPSFLSSSSSSCGASYPELCHSFYCTMFGFVPCFPGYCFIPAYYFTFPIWSVPKTPSGTSGTVTSKGSIVHRLSTGGQKRVGVDVECDRGPMWTDSRLEAQEVNRSSETSVVGSRCATACGSVGSVDGEQVDVGPGGVVGAGKGGRSGRCPRQHLRCNNRPCPFRLSQPAPPQRPWVSLNQPDVSKPIAIFTVMCYNVLSDQYATRQLYGYCPSWALNWVHRKYNILDEICQYAPDIIALQEVETEQFYEFFLPELRQEGYDGIFSPKSRAKTMTEAHRKHVDGCAIFYRTTKFSLVSEHLIEFNELAKETAQGSHDMINRVMTKDNIGLAAVLQLVEPVFEQGVTVPESCVPGNKYILLATCHMHWDPEYSDVKLIQTMMLTSKLRSIADEAWASLTATEPVWTRLSACEPCWASNLNDAGPSAAEPSSPGEAGQASDVIPLVLCGDLNSLPDSGVVEYLRCGSVSSKHRDFKDLGYDDVLRRLSSSDDKDIYSHSFNLSQAYLNNVMPFTNYTYDFKGIIDYIFYTSSTMTPLGLLGPLDPTWFKENGIVGCPNPQIPSDHLPLLVEFQVNFISAPSTSHSANSASPGRGVEEIGVREVEVVEAAPSGISAFTLSSCSAAPGLEGVGEEVVADIKEGWPE